MKDEQELRQIPIVCPGHSRPIAEVNYSSMTEEGFFLISACHDKLPMLRRGETGDWVGSFTGHKGAVWSSKLDTTATRAATGSADFTVKLWDAIAGTELHTFVQKHVVKSVEFNTSNTKLWTGGHDKIVREYDLTNYDSPVIEIPVSHQIRKVVSLLDGRVCTGESDGALRIWDMHNQKEIQTLQWGTSPIMDMELSSNGELLTVASGDTVRFFTTKDFKEVNAFKMPISFEEDGGASLHPTKGLFVAGGSDTWVRVFDSSTGKMLECHKGHHGPVRCLRYAPDGESYATGSEDGTIRIWQTNVASAAPTAAPMQ